jgi:WD40 repeat protein
MGGHQSSITALAAISNGRLASGSTDSLIKIWEVDPSFEVATLEGHKAAITALCFMPGNADILASASMDQTVRLWDTETYTQVSMICRLVTSLVLLPGGELASGSHDTAISLWLGNGLENEVAKLRGHADWVLSLAVLPGGNLASGSKDKSIKMWDVRKRRDVCTFKGHSDWVTALALLPSNCLASCSLDTTIKVWDLEERREMVTLRGHGLGVTAFAVMHSGWLAMGSRDKVIRVWTHTQSTERLKPKPRGPAVLAHTGRNYMELGQELRSATAKTVLPAIDAASPVDTSQGP